MKKKNWIGLCLFLAVFAGEASCQDKEGPSGTSSLKLPAGFQVNVLADQLGSARHIAVSPQGDLFIKLNSARGGKGIVVLHDEGNGKASVKRSFGDYGGTGIAIKNGYLYASSNSDVYRYKLNEQNEVVDPEHPEVVISGLTSRRTHNSKSIALDNEGNIYVNVGAYSNICTEFEQQDGCPVLQDAAGIWKFKADRLNQQQSDGVRYATGLRNVVGLDWNQQLNQLVVMQHGRDRLHDLFPDLYTEKQSAELPAECMFALKEGDNVGWPYVYYDWQQKKNLLGPEHGGDGKKEADPKFLKPLVGYPGHLAPNGLLFYTGDQFPARYKNGAFIAFHGSWNRAPEPQAGYFVVFQPFENGKPVGDWEIFADGFAGGSDHMQPGSALHRPCGLAQGPDGSLYVTDDAGGTVYKITYKK